MRRGCGRKSFAHDTGEEDAERRRDLLNNELESNLLQSSLFSRTNLKKLAMFHDLDEKKYNQIKKSQEAY